MQVLFSVDAGCTGYHSLLPPFGYLYRIISDNRGFTSWMLLQLFWSYGRQKMPNSVAPRLSTVVRDLALKDPNVCVLRRLEGCFCNYYPPRAGGLLNVQITIIYKKRGCMRRMCGTAPLAATKSSYCTAVRTINCLPMIGHVDIDVRRNHILVFLFPILSFIIPGQDTPLIFMAMFSTVPSMWLIVSVRFLAKDGGAASTTTARDRIGGRAAQSAFSVACACAGSSAVLALAWGRCCCPVFDRLRRDSAWSSAERNTATTRISPRLVIVTNKPS